MSIQVTKPFTNGETVVLHHEGKARLEILPDGAFYVDGKLTAVDREVYLGFRAWLEACLADTVVDVYQSQALAEAIKRRLAAEANLTETQARCTELIQENRDLKRKLGI